VQRLDNVDVELVARVTDVGASPGNGGGVLRFRVDGA
jgi:hypothetical protein